MHDHGGAHSMLSSCFQGHDTIYNSNLLGAVFDVGVPFLHFERSEAADVLPWVLLQSSMGVVLAISQQPM